MKLGANPLCWMNSDFPSIKNQVSVEACIAQIAEIGYRGVELEDPFVRELQHLRYWLSSKRLRCIGKWHSTFILEKGIKTELERLDQHIDMLKSLNAEVVILAECTGAIQQKKNMPLSRRPLTEDWDTLCAGLEKMAKLIEKKGLISAYHHHMGTVVQTKQDIDYLMKGTETLGLLFDTGHMAFAETNPLDVLKGHISRVTHVHCKNIRKDVLVDMLEQDADFFSAVMGGVFTVPGDGQGIDFSPIISLLFEHNYCGWVVMEAEQDPSIAEPYQYAHLGFHTLNQLITSDREPRRLALLRNSSLSSQERTEKV